MKTSLLAFLASTLLAHGAGSDQVLYENDFEKAEVGKLPDELMVLAGDFAVKRDGTNCFLELPGAPLDSFSLQFGPPVKVDVSVSATVRGTVRGRRTPSFGIGLGGAAGWKLQLVPAKRCLELWQDQTIQSSMPFEWESGAWTQLRLQVRQLGDGVWEIGGKAWPKDSAEPKDWTNFAITKAEPISGKASVFGSPFSGTPIWFDNFKLQRSAGTKVSSFDRVER